MIGKLTLSAALLGVSAMGIFVVRAGGQSAEETGVTRMGLIFSGGHETDRRDGGRPVVLVAAGLNVPPEKFREAFNGVTPARGGAPEPAQVRRNKQALLKVLGPLGVTNDRLDEVSNFYRYRPQEGELWNHKEAKAYAKVKDGAVVGFEIADPGYGYSSAPSVIIEGMPGVKVVATISVSTDLQKNGSVGALALEGAATRPSK